jgi:dihydrolipoamide dehydrogenase
MATAWRELGSADVTVVQRGPRLVASVEPFAGEQLAAAFQARGIRVHLNANATRATRRADGTVTLALADGTSITADELLVATGREPRTHDVGLERVGLAPGSWLAVDASLRVTGVAGGWLYAVGDVNHRALLTHMGKYQARACGDVIVARAGGHVGDAAPAAWSSFAATADELAVPQVIFTDPEIAAVGISEAEARRRGQRVRAVDYEIGKVAGAHLYADGYRGRARMVVDEDRRAIVGMTLIGPAVGEMIHAATIAVAGAVPLERLWHAVPSYPTISELWLRLLEAYGL